ncbi:MAG: hypothetical protein JEY97_13065 [Bacteroidales bacterium]|nr:hypothetical protein [Bacteroidales bacterium]
MKNIKLLTFSIFLITLLILIVAGCSSRIETPVKEADSTIVYPAKNPNGIMAGITLYRKMSNQTDKLLGEGTVFTIREKENLNAKIDLKNRFACGKRELIFHIDWIGTNGRSFYRKQIDLSHVDSSSTINTSISIPPDKRQPGNYSIRIYLFRELIAEKKFELIPESEDITSMVEKLDAKITLYRKKSKKSGKLIGEGNVFTIKKKAKVRAFVDLGNRYAFDDRELEFQIEWKNDSSESIYSKEIELFPDDSTTSIKSALSVSPQKRQAGNYIFQVFLFRKLVAEKKFELK